MIFVSAWQTLYIFSRRPVDYSMIGFAVFGLLIFFLSLYYRPLRLLDRMLAAIASRMPESLFFFDTTGRCIWLNDKAVELLSPDKKKPSYLDEVNSKLTAKIGDYKTKEGEHLILLRVVMEIMLLAMQLNNIQLLMIIRKLSVIT